MRKVIQISSASYDDGVAINALCDDGTMWEMNAGRWVELPAIPQDESKDPLAVARGKLNDIHSLALGMVYPVECAFTSGTAALEAKGHEIVEIVKR